ncbi:hypothetical protein J4221_07345 [Candidatus Pacearchaeota archaeon]|nr:hypothetical protein [Candidatus Pacearchaeota archaeon]
MSKTKISFISGIIFILCLFISLNYVSAIYSATSNVRYINRTYVAEVNISIVSGLNGSYGNASNITQVLVVLPQGFSFINGTNISTLAMAFFNTSSVLIWNTTDSTLFGNNTQNDFRFNVTSSIAGDANIIVNNTRNDSWYNFTSLSITTNFDFSGVVVNSTGQNESNVNVTIYEFSFAPGSPPVKLYRKSALTNADGSFTLSSINGSGTNYVLETIRYGNSTNKGCSSSNSSCSAVMTGTVLPPFPAMLFYPQSSDFDMSLNGSTFYLQDAATLRLYTNGLNTSGTLVQQRFGYQVIDQKVGFPVDSNLQTNVSTVDVVIPAGKDYSVMFMRDFARFGFDPGCNGTVFNDSFCPSPPITNSSLGTINAGDIVVVNQSLTITRNRLIGCINVQAGHNTTALNVTKVKIKMIPFTTSSGSFVPEFEAGGADVNISDVNQLNGTDSSGTASTGAVVCNGATGSLPIAAYNISVLGSDSGITYFLEFYAKNASLVYENATNVGGNYLAGFANITITGNTQKNITLYRLLGGYINDSVNKAALNTSLMKINILNDTGGAVTTDMHVEAKVKNSNVGIGTVNYMIETITNGTFYIPILNNSNYAEISVFPNDAPPMTKKLNLSSSENNITLVSIDFGEGDKGMRQFNASGDLEAINVSSFPVTIRFLRRGTEQVITEMNSSDFNPLKALVAGQVDLELKVTATNVTMRFNNFDMFSAKQPPMFAVLDNDTAASSSQTWKFGNFVPKDVYDNVTLIIPYNENSISESGTFNMSIPILYTEDPSKTHQMTTEWNISAGYSTSNLTDEFIAYNNSRYRDYLTSAGVECSKTSITSVCYINTTGNEIRMEIPHFSGLSPSMVITAAASSSTSSSSSSGGGATDSVITVTPNLLNIGYTTSVKKGGSLKLNFSSGELHTLKINELLNNSITITVSSEPQTATVNIGEIKKFNLNNDNYYDLSVTLNSINSKLKSASITFKAINELIPVSEEKKAETEKPVKTEEGKIEENIVEESPDTKNLVFFWIIAFVIILILLVIFILLMARKKR